jgi:hypothetical protein
LVILRKSPQISRRGKELGQVGTGAKGSLPGTLKYDDLNLGVVPDSPQHQIQLVPHPDVIGIQSLGTVEGNITSTVLLLINDDFKIAHLSIYLTPLIPFLKGETGWGNILRDKPRMMLGGLGGKRYKKFAPL